MHKISDFVKRIILGHLLALALAFFCLLVFSWAVGHLLFGIVVTYIYALTMYSTGWMLGQLDSRLAGGSTVAAPRYLHGEEPQARLKKMIIASIVVTIPTVILLGLRIAAPIWFADVVFRTGTMYPGAMIGYEAVIYHEPTMMTLTVALDLIYRVWLLPCLYFFGEFNERVNLAYVLPVFIVPIFSIFGYIVGRKRFSIVEKFFPRIMYRREK